MNPIRFAIAIALFTPALFAQTYVSLKSQQSPLKNQGARGACICFAGIAALEARYRRQGYGVLDLSEEFCNNVLNKTFWLHPNWDDKNGPAPRLAVSGADRAENQIATEGGGSGPGVIEALATGGAVPQERYMRYVSTQTTLRPFADYRHPHWQSQRNTNTWNLDRKRLPRTALTAPRYYSIKSFGRLSNPRDPASIENVLKTGREVVWDFYVGGNRRTNGLWTTTNDSTSGLGSHSMLIVGFDKRSRNANDWHFIVKNSWGAGGAMPDGYTHISYGYLRKYGFRSAYIHSVNPPKPWPELAAVGRWNLSFDGHRGTLDIYHIPGTAQHAIGKTGITDRRLGTFYDSKGVAHRVNGKLQGDIVEFWFKGSNPNMCWDEQRETPKLGRRFWYVMMDPRKGIMAGWHQDNSGYKPKPAWGGYARVATTINGTNGFLNPKFDDRQAIRPEMHLGLWNANWDGNGFQINIVRRNDSRLTAVERLTYAGFEAVAIEGSRRRNFTARVLKSRPADIRMVFPHSRANVSISAFMLSHQRGATGGHGYHGNPSILTGFYMYRVDASIDPGKKVLYGSGCKGSNGVPTHRIAGTPIVGKRISFDLFSGAKSSQCLLSLGVKRTNIDLSPIGALGCRLYTDQIAVFGLRTAASGTAAFSVALPNARGLMGFSLTSQYGITDRRANAQGLTTSNGAQVTFGGVR